MKGFLKSVPILSISILDAGTNLTFLIKQKVHFYFSMVNQRPPTPIGVEFE
jgi:hypothetical protein